MAIFVFWLNEVDRTRALYDPLFIYFSVSSCFFAAELIQSTEVTAASRAKMRLALTEKNSDRQKQFLEEAVCGPYYEKFACMCGMLYLAGQWEKQGIDGLQSAFADYHGFAQRALSI